MSSDDDESIDSNEDEDSIAFAKPGFDDPECDPYRLDINFLF